MHSVQQNQFALNNQPLVIGDFSIRQDEDGRYCLNDLHKASGDLAKHKPANFLRSEQTQELISEIDSFSDMRSCIKVANGVGTFAAKELVYSYAMWISAKFHLIVIRAYDMMVTQWKVNDRQSISPEQQGLLHEIVARRSNGERKIFAEMWARHNRHFKIAKYSQLLAIHFPEAVHYLEVMDVKAKPAQQEVKALPYPQEVVQVAQQIDQEYKAGRYDSWFVTARDGVLSVMPVPHGYYVFNVKEFTKHFDGVLNVLYGSDTLTQGRHFLNQAK